MIYRLIACTIVNIACQPAVVFPYSHVKQAWSGFLHAATVLRVSFAHDHFEVCRFLDNIDYAAFVFDCRQAKFVYGVSRYFDGLIFGFYLPGDRVRRGKKH